jgi:hypothetical protein
MPDPRLAWCRVHAGADIFASHGGVCHAARFVRLSDRPDQQEHCANRRLRLSATVRLARPRWRRYVVVSCTLLSESICGVPTSPGVVVASPGRAIQNPAARLSHGRDSRHQPRGARRGGRAHPLVPPLSLPAPGANTGRRGDARLLGRIALVARAGCSPRSNAERLSSRAASLWSPSRRPARMSVWHRGRCWICSRAW